MAAVEIFFLGLLGLASCASIAADNAGLGGLTLFFLPRLFAGRWRPPLPVVLLVVFFAWNVVSALASPLRWEAIQSIPHYWSWTALLTASAIPLFRRRLDIFAALMSLSAIASAVVAVFEFITGADWPVALRMATRQLGVNGARGFFSNGLTYAGVITIAGLFLAGRAIYGRERKAVAILLWAAVAACFLGLLLSKERAYWLALLPAAALLSLGKGWKRATAVAAAVLLAILLLLALGPAALRQRLYSINDASDQGNLERIYLWRSAIDIIADRPLAGWGFGTYQDVAPRYKAPYASFVRHPDGPPGFRTTSHAHNQYLMIAIHSGLIGLGIFAAFVFLAFRSVWRDCDDGIKYGVASGFTAFLIGGLFEYNGGDAEVATLMFFLLGLAMPGYRESAARVTLNGPIDLRGP